MIMIYQGLSFDRKPLTGINHMTTDDSQAAQQFLDSLKGLDPAPPAPLAQPPNLTQITINRPVRCTIVFGAASYTQQARKGGQ